MKGAQKIASLSLANFVSITHSTFEATLLGAELGIESKSFDIKSRLFLLH